MGFLQDHDGFVSSDELLAFATTLNNANNDKVGDVKSLETNGEIQTVVDDGNDEEAIDLIQNDAGDQGVLPSDATEEDAEEDAAGAAAGRATRNLCPAHRPGGTVTCIRTPSGA